MLLESACSQTGVCLKVPRSGWTAARTISDNFVTESGPIALKCQIFPVLSQIWSKMALSAQNGQKGLKWQKNEQQLQKKGPKMTGNSLR